jgi:hypothetical protein
MSTSSSAAATTAVKIAVPSSSALSSLLSPPPPPKEPSVIVTFVQEDVDWECRAHVEGHEHQKAWRTKLGYQLELADLRRAFREFVANIFASSGYQRAHLTIKMETGMLYENMRSDIASAFPVAKIEFETFKRTQKWRKEYNEETKIHHGEGGSGGGGRGSPKRKADDDDDETKAEPTEKKKAMIAKRKCVRGSGTLLCFTNDYDGTQSKYFFDTIDGMKEASEWLKQQAARIRKKPDYNKRFEPSLFIHRVGPNADDDQLHSDQDWDTDNSLNPQDDEEDGEGEEEEEEEEKRITTHAYPTPGKSCACIKDRPCTFVHSLPFGRANGVREYTTRKTPDGPEEDDEDVGVEASQAD